MKYAGLVVGIAVLGACSSHEHEDEDEAASNGADQAARLRATTGMEWLVDVDAARGTVTLAMPRSPTPSVIAAGETAGAAALRFLSAHEDVFGPVSRVQLVRSEVDADGGAHVRLAQVVDGSAIPNGYVVHFTKAGALSYVNGTVDPAYDGSVVPNGSFDLDGSGKGIRFYPPISDPSDVTRIEISRTETGYVLVRAAVDGEPAISTFDANEAAPIASTDPDAWDPIAPGGSGAGAAVDAHRHVAQTVAWYHDRFAWHDFDQPSEGITVRVHVNEGAHASYGAGGLSIGDGDATAGGDNLPYTDLSVLAHELTHGVTAHCSGLAGEGEEGSINEALSDVFSALVSHDVAPERDPFAIGAGGTVSGKAIRRLDHPSRSHVPTPPAGEDCGYPATAPDNAANAYRGACDSGGSHLNAGIPGNAFALMTLGGANDTSRITIRAPLGWDTARALWWATERFVVLGGTRRTDLARWQLATAAQSGIPLVPVACAWRAVGVLDAAYLAAKWSIRCDG